MRDHRLTLWSLSLGLAVWAVLPWMRTNPAKDLTRLQASAPVRAAVVDATRSPARLYASSCASCHQSQGEGRFPVFPPLAGSPWANGDPDRLIAITLHGLSGPVDVNGIGYSGLMPGFSHLSDREVADVLTHVRGSWGNDAPPVTEADVAAVRSRTVDRRPPWTTKELMAERGAGQ
ncbi:c-type cytochrome [Lysobacter niastensis]|uniref:Cytochrome c n=1 Tax=Lysobacter niastensis TaxID=380629 RepID=A0ABS0B8U8_9GAMM|nr:cytochrome c [Lysobacter niastensis]MBF6025438.1 cytochrome c [Lysobacter niastensis]